MEASLMLSWFGQFPTAYPSLGFDVASGDFMLLPCGFPLLPVLL
jgi:hypothetical protein